MKLRKQICKTLILIRCWKWVTAIFVPFSQNTRLYPKLRVSQSDHMRARAWTFTKHPDKMFTVWRRGRLHELHRFIKATHLKITHYPFCRSTKNKTTQNKTSYTTSFISREIHTNAFCGFCAWEKKNVKKAWIWQICICSCAFLYGYKAVFSHNFPFVSQLM